MFLTKRIFEKYIWTGSFLARDTLLPYFSIENRSSEMRDQSMVPIISRLESGSHHKPWSAKSLKGIRTVCHCVVSVVYWEMSTLDCTFLLGASDSSSSRPMENFSP